MRSGCPVRFVRYRTLNGERVQYAVRLQNAWISDQAATVAEAIEELNKLISQRRPAGSHGKRRWNPPVYSKFRQKFGGIA